MSAELAHLKTAIAALEAQRDVLGEAGLAAALAPLLARVAALEEPERPADAGERKQITVMFADLSGFTKLSESADAEDVPVGISLSPMLPITDASAFGERIARVRASEYVTQYLKHANVRFAAGSPPEAIGKFREDGWTLARYRDARNTIARVLEAHGFRLLEGKEGYAPAE